MLVLLGAGQTPSWLVSSPQVAFVVPLTVAIWFWTSKARKSAASGAAALGLAALGSALTKVVTAATLVPLAIAGLLPVLRRLPRYLQLSSVTLLAVIGIYALAMLAHFLPPFLSMVQTGRIGIGPNSYLDRKLGLSVWEWSQIGRDVATVLMVPLSFVLTDWPVAAALSFGAICVLTFPFLTMANFLCVTVALGLAAIDDTDRLRQWRWLVLPTFLLTVPSMLRTDESGIATGLVWAPVITAVVFIAVSALAVGTEEWRLRRGSRNIVVLGSATITLLFLVASADGNLVLNSGWHQGGLLTPDIRDIWRAVRERTPNSLVFTDETNREEDILGGFNLYVLNGRRQVYIAGWTTPAMQANPAVAEARMKVNADVLAARVKPSEIPTQGRYGAFFAVVSARTSMPAPWQEIYRNRTQALYRWQP